MYKNLKREMKKRGVLSSEIAELLGVRRETIYNKINGQISIGFTLDEALKIKEKYFPDMSIELLFEREGE